MTKSLTIDFNFELSVLPLVAEEAEVFAIFFLLRLLWLREKITTLEKSIDFFFTLFGQVCFCDL